MKIPIDNKTMVFNWETSENILFFSTSLQIWTKKVMLTVRFVIPTYYNVLMRYLFCESTLLATLILSTAKIYQT